MQRLAHANSYSRIIFKSRSWYDGHRNICRSTFNVLEPTCVLAHGCMALQLLYDCLEQRQCPALHANRTYAKGYLLALIKVRVALFCGLLSEAYSNEYFPQEFVEAHDTQTKGHDMRAYKRIGRCTSSPSTSQGNHRLTTFICLPPYVRWTRPWLRAHALSHRRHFSGCCNTSGSSWTVTVQLYMYQSILVMRIFDAHTNSLFWLS